MKTILTIKGTHCAACKALIEDVCNDDKSVSSCTVDFKTGRTEIEHNAEFNFEALRTEIESVGAYSVKPGN